MGQLNEVRQTIFATSLIAVGVQVVFESFFLSFLQFRKSIHDTPLQAAQPDPDLISAAL